MYPPIDVSTATLTKQTLPSLSRTRSPSPCASISDFLLDLVDEEGDIFPGYRGLRDISTLEVCHHRRHVIISLSLSRYYHDRYRHHHHHQAIHTLIYLLSHLFLSHPHTPPCSGYSRGSGQSAKSTLSSTPW